MNASQILATADKYDSHLKGYPIERILTSAIIPSPEKALGHVRWMFQQFKGILDNGHNEKAHRWLGFAQGVLWMTGRGRIDDFKRDNGG